MDKTHRTPLSASNRTTIKGVVAILTLMLTLWSTTMSAQTLALKTNVLYSATTTPNLGVEVGLSRRLTGQLYYGFNGWEFNCKGGQPSHIKHWLLMPELRWWQCSTFNGWFYGVHLMGGEFNAGNAHVPVPGAFFSGENLGSMIRDSRCEGKYLGGGVTVGYQWILGKHWNLEAELGAGYNHVWYDQYRCSECGARLSTGNTNYIGLTKAGIALLYIF